MKIVLMIGLLIFSILASAEIYMQTDPNGSVIYSDTPTQGAKIITLPESNALSSITASHPAAPAAEKSTDGKEAVPAQVTKNSPYTRFLIDSPLDKQTITNQQEIPLTVVVEPELQKGDTIQVYLDGKSPQGAAAKTTFELTNVERGEHQLYAVIRDQDSNLLKQSQTITVYIHYAHVGN
jgi:hypothetical protein